jgi:nucleotide-binding universal stress UspA family protein
MNILLAVDHSRDAELAAQYLIALPLPHDADVTLLHVIPHSHPLSALSESPDLVKGLGTIRQRTKAKAEQFMGAMQKQVSRREWKVRSLITEGSSADEILRAIERDHIGLSIVGTRGISGIQRFVLGSVSEQVLNYAACSVCIVREEPQWVKDPTARGMRILLATDGSPDAKAAMKFLNHLELSSAEIHVLHVMDTTHDPHMDQAGSDKPELVQMAESIREHQIRSGTIVLEEIRPVLRQKFRLEALARGHVAEEIIKAAKRLQPDLLVVGSRGLRSMTRGLLGSVSHNVARYASCSVLVVRQTADATRVQI